MKGKPDGETAAEASGAVQLQPPAVGANQVTGDGQAQPHALRKSRAELATEVGFKDVDLLLLWNARAAVPHSNSTDHVRQRPRRRRLCRRTA